MKQLNQHIAAFLILLITAGGYANLKNMHFHILPNGQIVAHSHFYDDIGSEGKGHFHSENEFNFFNLLDKIFNIAILPENCSVNIKFVYKHFFSDSVSCKSLLKNIFTQERAPPAFSLYIQFQ